MARSLSAAMRAAGNAQETGEVILGLLTLSHPDILTQRFVNNHVSIVSRGETFQPYPFDVTLPDDRDDEVVRVRISIDNIDRNIVAAIRSVTTPATFLFEVIRAAAPDAVEAKAGPGALRNVSWDHMTVSGDITYEPLLDEPAQQYQFSPIHFDALFTAAA
jgi:hypothetical protein